ncbi:MAG: hypothetical protein LPK80_11950 [Bacteroidota bacterium]|nr:hypothetical protein [Bacteroidota bacterium]
MASSSRKNQGYLLFLLVLITRIPFLGLGYGIEEDSWGHVENAWEIFSSGRYVLSRLPGHPLYEFLLTLLWPIHSYWVYNGLSALASAGCILIFYRLMRWYGLPHPFWTSLALASVPVLFVSGTYTIDYSLSLFFVLLSYDRSLRQQPILAGIWLGVATGFRITSLIWGLPIFLILLTDPIKGKPRVAIRFATIALISSLAYYLPALVNYGWGFFDFHRPPYPSLVEGLYKMSIGVTGVLGFLGLMISIPWRRTGRIPGLHLIFWVLAFLLYALAYWRMPEKAAFWLPVLPFIFLFWASGKHSTIKTMGGILILLSPWFFGINITDPYRGSDHSSYAYLFKTGNGETFLDPVQGPLLNDATKRIRKMEFSNRTELVLDTMTRPSHVIAGWWYAMLEVDRLENKWANGNVHLHYYLPPEKMDSILGSGMKLYVLPDQADVNDLKYGIRNTSEKAFSLNP